jgi:hypothetical protein
MLPRCAVAELHLYRKRCNRATHGVQHQEVGAVTDTRIPLSSDRRAQLKALKRGDETYDQLLEKMIEQYDPDEAAMDPDDVVA